jgi:hypothetical protein
MEFWDRVKGAIIKQNTTQEWVAKASGLSFASFRGWITKDRLPRIDDAVAIGRALDVTAEELVLGQPGRDYVIDWAGRHGAKWKPPNRLQELWPLLEAANDNTIEMAVAMVRKSNEIFNKEKRESEESTHAVNI